ncbi:PREDICTED: uncharacterized protein LOC105593988 isoform X3 [Cercocebus atys]|uniref:uncharacterized protein LOC105593988 isoform X3 n=1 Tax=Cercocebus atys TaxID=9531 RepID=UPI0005F48D49|nr:PREDICTED: uncharacterized protein LOC105593988 isoform X3 [Cercocebus atys]
MSVSGFKAKLKLLAVLSSTRTRSLEPPPRLHCNITPVVFKLVFKEKLTMKTESLTEEKLECSLWCCLSDPSPQGLAALLCSGKAHCTLEAADKMKKRENSFYHHDSHLETPISVGNGEHLESGIQNVPSWQLLQQDVSTIFELNL